jgi:Flp pilus assembly pilin Flp
MLRRFPPADSLERGETLVEYILMLALILVLVLLTAVTVGDRTSFLFNNVSNELIRLIH